MFRDVTREEKIREQHYNLKVETVEMARKVIEKQMMVAQEIAGLLGRDHGGDQSDSDKAAGFYSERGGLGL